MAKSGERAGGLWSGCAGGGASRAYASGCMRGPARPRGGLGMQGEGGRVHSLPPPGREAEQQRAALPPRAATRRLFPERVACLPCRTHTHPPPPSPPHPCPPQLKLNVAMAAEWAGGAGLDAATLAAALKRIGYNAAVKEAPAPVNLPRFKTLRHQYLVVAMPGERAGRGGEGVGGVRGPRGGATTSAAGRAPPPHTHAHTPSNPAPHPPPSHYAPAAQTPPKRASAL